MCLLGYKQLAEAYLNNFKWGKTFLSLNSELLDKYAACANSSEVIAAQNEYLKMLDDERNRDRGISK